MKLWLVRHAATLAAPEHCWGSTDLAADTAETRLAAQALAAELPAGIVMRSSPLQRCERLSQAICGLRADLTSSADARLAEMHFGRWEGLRWDEIGAQALTAWTDDFARHRPGGGESVEEFMARVAAAFDDTLAQGRDAVWITHAGVIRAATLLAAGQRSLSRADEWPVTGVACGQWQVLRVTRDRYGIRSA